MILQEKKPAINLDLYQALLLHKRPMTWTFSAIMLMTVAVTFLSSKTYTSEAKLFVRLGRESMGLDPTTTAATDNVVMVHESREFEINSVFELLKSRAVLSNVVSTLGPQLVLGKSVDARVQTAGVLGTSIELFSPYSPEDAALKRLASTLNVQPVKKSNVINISCDAKSPELARDIIAALIEQARDVHIRVNRADGSHEFFANQAEKLREKVTRLEADLRDLKNKTGVASLGDQRALKLQQISDLQLTLLKAEATLSASNAEMQVQKDHLTKLPETVTTSRVTGMPHSAVSAMREQLFEAQVREKELLSKFTKEHPMVVAITQQVAALQAVVASEPVEPQVALGPNSAHQEIHLAYLKGESSSESTRAQAVALREQLGAARQELTELNNTEAEIVRLEREVEMETANYKRYSENLEQARIDHELVTKNISNLNVLQPPTYSITPTRPRRLINLALGFFAAASASLGVGLCLEQRRSGWLYRLIGSGPARDHSLDRVIARTQQEPTDRAWDYSSNGNGNGNGNGNEDAWHSANPR